MNINAPKPVMTKKQLIQLLRGDLTNLIRDPLMLLIMGVPVYMYILLTWGIPYVDRELSDLLAFQLTDYLPLLYAFVSLIAPMLLGLLAGFLVLDEKDDGILQYMTITPFSKSGFIGYRMAMPWMISVVVTGLLLTALLSGASGVRWGLLIIAVLLSSGLSPIVTLFLAAFCSNKVEGMTYSKLLSLLASAPLLTFFIDHWWVTVLYVLPVTWMVELIYLSISGVGGEVLQSPVQLIAGGVITTVLTIYLLLLKVKKDEHF